MILKRLLIAGFIAFACLQVYFISIRVQNYPFFIYDMYSRPVGDTQPIIQYRFIADGDTLYPSTLPIMAEGMLVNSLKIYDHRISSGSDYWNQALTSRQNRLGKSFRRRSERFLRNEPADVAQYPAWLHRYVETHMTDRKVGALTVERLRLVPQGPTVQHSAILFTYPASASR